MTSTKPTMPRIYTIIVPRNVQPTFPNRCTVCGVEHPKTSCRVLGRNGLEGHAILSGWYSIRIPCCRSCGLLLQIWRIWDLAATFVIAGAALAFGLFYMLPKGHEGWVCGLTTLGLCCLGFLVQFIWNRIFPPGFQIDPHARNVDYEFRNRVVFEEFCELNGANRTP